MLPNNVSETHAELGDPLILDEAETGPLIPFKLVCADLGIGRRTGGRRVPLRDSWSTFHHGELLGVNPDDKLICINYGDDLTQQDPPADVVAALQNDVSQRPFSTKRRRIRSRTPKVASAT
jgi:hypothetical protein